MPPMFTIWRRDLRGQALPSGAASVPLRRMNGHTPLPALIRTVRRARTAVCWTMPPCLTNGTIASRVSSCGLFLNAGDLRLEARS